MAITKSSFSSATIGPCRNCSAAMPSIAVKAAQGLFMNRIRNKLARIDGMDVAESLEFPIKSILNRPIHASKAPLSEPMVLHEKALLPLQGLFKKDNQAETGLWVGAISHAIRRCSGKHRLRGQS